MSADWSSAQYWEHFYEVADTPWELGHPSPVLQEAIAEARALGFALDGKKVLVPGCGTGSDAGWLAQQGALVQAVDFSARAVAETQARLEKLPQETRQRVALQQADFFELSHSGYAGAAEHTFFCAIDPGSRKRYAEAMARAIVPGGFLAGNFFVLPDDQVAALPSLALRYPDNRPPFVASEGEIRSLFSASFELLVLRPARNPSPDRRPGLEWVGVFRRRNSSLAG